MGTKNFSNANDLITFSRSSAGTALRKIAYGSELVTNGDFDTDISGWTTQAGGSTFTVSSGQLTISRSAVDPGYVYQTISTTAGNVYYVTFGVIDNGPIDLRVGTSPAGLQITSSGIKSSAGTYTLAFVATGASTYISLVNTSYSTDATVDNISVKEVLFDQGTLTLFNHPAGIPRIEYDADGNVLGLLVEESRTNLVTYSEDFSQWSAVGAGTSIVSLSELDPAGSSNAALIKNTGGAYSIASSNITTSLGDTYTVSFWVKSAGLGNDSFRLYFDGSVISGNFTATSEWQRFSFTGTSDGSGSVAVTRNTSNDPFDLYIWGAQLEAGDFPTSYIPTAGATATRSADVASIPVADFGYNQSEGTVVVEGTQYESSNSISRFVELYGGGTGSGGYLSLGVYQDSSWIETYNGDVLNLYDVKVSGERQKMASGFDSSGNTFCGDGNILGTPSTSSLVNPSSVSLLYVGVHWAGIQQLNGHIKSIKYFPRKLTNAQLQELTT